MHFDPQMIYAIGLGIALSACCGFRVFVPLLAGAIAAYNNWFNVPTDMQWLGSWPAIICFATASVVEIAAYYFPFLDNLLDTTATPLSVIAGTILATAILPIQDGGFLKWGIGLLAGGTTAGTIQLGSSMLRLFSTKATLGTGNAFLATGENAAAVTGSVLSFLVPVLVAIIIIVLVIWIAYSGARQLLVLRHNKL